MQHYMCQKALFPNTRIPPHGAILETSWKLQRNEPLPRLLMRTGRCVLHARRRMLSLFPPWPVHPVSCRMEMYWILAEPSRLASMLRRKVTLIQTWQRRPSLSTSGRLGWRRRVERNRHYLAGECHSWQVSHREDWRGNLPLTQVIISQLTLSDKERPARPTCS